MEQKFNEEMFYFVNASYYFMKICNKNVGKMSKLKIFV